jgi:hypothetical protein
MNMDLMLERPGEANAKVTVRRLDRSEVPVRLRLLSYDGCEFDCRQKFAAGERIDILIYRMGWIRARVGRQHGRVVEADFDMDCPV